MRRTCPSCIHGNVINHGLIDNLPQGLRRGGVMVDRNGFNPCRYGPLPAADGGHLRQQHGMFDLAAMPRWRRAGRRRRTP